MALSTTAKAALQTMSPRPACGPVVHRTIRVYTFLAPNMLPVYQSITRYLGDRLGFPTELKVGSSYAEVSEADVAFLCGLPYVELRDRGGVAIEPLAAPILRGDRYGGKAVYFSDVIVHRDSLFRTFADLRGRSWAYNEPLSHSGYGVTRYRLVQLGETNGYFGAVVEAGWHERSLDMVRRGAVDASAIDSQVLAVALRDDPELASELRIIDTFGPSPIQPVVAASGLPDSLKADLQAALVEMANVRAVREDLERGFVERFVPVTDADYHDIRQMRAAAETADFLALR